MSVSLLFHPSCLSRSSVRLARAHQRCPELLRGTQSLGDLFLPPQCNLLLLLPSYESVSLLQHKVHLSAHVAPPELLRGKVTFFTWENKTNKEIAFSETQSASDILEQVSYCHSSMEKEQKVVSASSYALVHAQTWAHVSFLLSIKKFKSFCIGAR